MKIIKANDIINSKNLPTNLISQIDAISNLVDIEKDYIQFVKSEQEDEILDSFMHPLVHAIHLAYSSHVPVVLTPDIIWYCVSSAFAVYINKNSETLRKNFVDHEGKKVIEIRRDDFVFGSKTNPWNEVVDDFTAKIKEFTKSDIVDKLEADYSTTTKISRVVSQIVIMDAMQSYFEYYCRTCCGIPEIRVAGNKDDWVKIKVKTNNFVEILPELKDWIESLNEILDNFISIYDDKINKPFWNEIYKVGGGSGGPYITGWMITLFPYLDKQNKNPYCWNKKTWREAKGMFSGLHTSDFKYHMNQVPFTWNYYGNEIEMLFIGGLIGVQVEKADSALTPVFGYAVTEDKRRPQKKPDFLF